VALSFAWLYLEFGEVNPLAHLALALGLWITLYSAYEMKLTWQKIGKWPVSHLAMICGHVGLAFVIAGIGLTSQYSTERDVKMFEGDSAELSGYDFRFGRIENIDGPNYEGWAAIMEISKDNKRVGELLAEKRFYPVQRNTMTEAAIEDGFFRDLYVSLGERLPDDSWALRLYVKPYVRWLWIGGFIIAIGGFLTLTDRRYRQNRRLS
jgi:cytochrome c-type biogenesis protein CcmF